MAEDPRLIEKVEVLDGTRTGAKRRAAIRVEDMAAILQLPARLQSLKAAGAAPTAAEFDALVSDVALIHARLLEIATALQAKVI